MTVENVASDEVAAMRFDEDVVAADLAHWCGGTVVQVDGRCGIRVPVPGGLDVAYHGDWIVRRLGRDEFAVMGPDEFAAQMEPRPADDPLTS
jgi:hypothetical protein